MTNFYQNQTFTITTDDNQTVTYTIAKVCDDGRLLVRSSLLERAYFLSQEAFGDFLRVIGWQEEEKPAKYKVWLLNFNRYFGPNDEYNSFNDALKIGIMSGANFQIRLGDMICATWVPIGGLKWTEEYKQWYQQQQVRLNQVEGSYP